MKKIIFLLFIPAIFLASCKKNNVEDYKSDLGVSYFPLKLGIINKYTIDTIKYNSILNTKDSIREYIKEVITEENKDSSGFINYKVELYHTSDTNKNWIFKDYYFYKKDRYAINYENRGNIISLFIFPVSKGVSWNMNLYNLKEPKIARYSFVAKPFNIYQDCVEVFIKDDINIIEESIDKSVYSKDIGLIYKISSEVSINNSKKNGTIIVTNRVL